MTYKQKLTKIGNSFGIVIPKDVRDMLGLKAGSELYLVPSADKKTVILQQNTPSKDIDPSFFEIVKEVDAQYSEALKKMANK